MGHAGKLLHWILVCCFIGGLQAEEFILCPGAPSRIMECPGPDEVIDVHRARLVYSQNIPCSDTDIIQKVKTGEAVQCEDELPLTQCHGEKSCSVDGTLIGRVVNCLYGHTSNLLFVQFSCYKFADDTTIQTSDVSNSVTGQTVDIVSPGFPCLMPQQPDLTAVACRITPNRQNINDWVKIRVEYKLIRFDLQQTNCLNQIYTQRIGSTQVMNWVCNIEGYPTNVRNNKHRIDETGSLDVFSSHKAGSTGAKFWIQVTGESNGAVVDLNVSCSHTYRTPVVSWCGSELEPLSSSPSETTTTTTRSTAAPATQMPETPAPQTPSPTPPPPPNATNSPPAATDSDPAHGAPTTASQEDNDSGESGETTTSEAGDKSEQPVTSKEKDESNTTLYAILGGLVGLILLAALIILLVLFLLRKRKSDKTDEELIAGENVYSDVKKRNTSLKEKLKQVGNTLTRKKDKTQKNTADGEEMYATVGDGKKQKTKGKGKGEGKGENSAGNVYATVGEEEKKKKNEKKDKKEKTKGKGNEEGKGEHSTGNVYATVGDTEKKKKKEKKDMRDKKEKKKKEEEDENVEGDTYATVDKKKKKKNKDKENGGFEAGVVVPGNVYATIDKSKKKSKTDSPQTDTDETVMCENDDLYEKSNLAKGNDEFDETENDLHEDDLDSENDDDLYEESDFRGNPKNPEKEDDDEDEDSERVRYEENELYSSSVDLTEDGDNK